jgi:hypothetical protein
MSNATYRQEMHAAYQGELIGESLYRELARRSTDPVRKAKLDAIAAPACDAESIQFVVDHEVTLVEFVRVEMTAMESDSAFAGARGVSEAQPPLSDARRQVVDPGRHQAPSCSAARIHSAATH